jgi:hypothetical protein
MVLRSAADPGGSSFALFGQEEGITCFDDFFKKPHRERTTRDRSEEGTTSTADCSFLLCASEFERHYPSVESS